MSGGDLAPFVAAALRDKVMMEASEEIQQLRAENQRLRAQNALLEGVPKAEFVSANGKLLASGTFERGSCLDVEESACSLHRIDPTSTLSSLLRSQLRISGKFWGDVSKEEGEVDYAEWYGDFARFSIQFYGFHFTVGIATDDKHKLMALLGTQYAEVQDRSSATYYSDFDCPLSRLNSMYGHFIIEDVVVWVDAMDMILRTPSHYRVRA